MTTQDRVTSSMNDSGTGSKTGTDLTQGRSGFDLDLTLENTRRGLYHAGRIAGWKTWRGHRISNLIGMTDTYRTATGDQKVNLAKSIERTMDELASDRQ